MTRQKLPQGSPTLTTMSDQESPVPQPTASSAKPKAFQRPRPRRVANGSILDIIRRNPGCALFVRPLCWTDQHAQLLDIRFNRLPPCNTPVPINKPGSSPPRGHMRPSKTITTLSRALTGLLVCPNPVSWDPWALSRYMNTVMSTLWPDSFGGSLFGLANVDMHLHFGKWYYPEVVRVQGMWNYPSDSCLYSQASFGSLASTQVPDREYDSTPPPPPPPSPSERELLQGRPMVGYLGRSHLASVRQSVFRVARGAQRNEPVSRLQELRTRSMIPEDADCDPYIASVMIAMAQKHFYKDHLRTLTFRRRGVPLSAVAQPFRDIRLRLLTHDEETADFIVYTGHVTATFLERFRRPHRTPRAADGKEETSGDLGLTIDYVRVPVWPILGLRERLGKALGEDVVGAFDADTMETWEDDGEWDVPSSFESGRDSGRFQSESGSRSGSLSGGVSVGGKRKRATPSPVLGAGFEELGEEDQTPPARKKRRRLQRGTPREVVV